MNTFEIIFDAPSIDCTLYPERSMQGINSIVVDCDGRHIIPKGDGIVMLKVKNDWKTYTNVFSVCPYVYQEWGV